nr:hypothetical protein [Nitrosomonas nitrosa]
MARLSLSYAGHVSDRVQDIYYGAVKPEAVDLHFIPLQPFQAFPRMLSGEFDCAEMSFSTYVIMMAHAKAGGAAVPFVAIPVFPSRTFRHAAIYINRAAGISQPEDLVGRNVGVPEYQMTAAVWVRGLLMHEYGVMPTSIRWTTGGLRDPGRKAMVATSVPNVEIRYEGQKTLDSMLVAGELDALIAPQPPPSFREGHPAVQRLFPDTTAAEQAYYRKTGLFPIMHVVVLRKEIYERHPWSAVSLYEAFDRAKNNCIDRLRVEEPVPTSIPWASQLVNAAIDAMGFDFWPYGIEPNRKVIETLCGYVFEQGLALVRAEVDDLFAPNVARLSEQRL